MAKYTLKELKDKYYNVVGDYLKKQSLYFEVQKELNRLERAFFMDCRYCEHNPPCIYNDDDDEFYEDEAIDNTECLHCVYMNGFKPTKEWLLKTKKLLADNKKED